MGSIRYYINPEYSSKVEIKTCNSYLHSSKSHLHNEISIGVVDRGSCTLELYNKDYFITEKTVLIIPSGVIHKCNPTNLENWSFKMLYIDSSWLTQNFGAESSFRYKELESESYKKINEAFSKIGKSKSSIEEECNLFELLANILKMDDSNYNRVENFYNYTVKIDKVREYIDNCYLNNVTLSELEEVSGVSKYYLIRKFEEMYGISPYKYINSKKSAHAKTLLKTNSNIAEVAVESGFYDQSHFNKIFKEYSGVTPFQYLKNLKK